MSTAAPTQWKTLPAPGTPAAWIERAAEVAALLATDAAARDKAGATPYTEIQLLKDSGLVTLLGPAAHGGGGQDWTTAYRVIREVAKADGSIGQLLGYHYLWNWAARLVGTREQWEHVEAEAVRQTWFFGGAVNPRDTDVVVTEDGDDLVFTGAKTFSTGSKVSDVTVLEGVLGGTDQHIFAIVPSDSEGLVFHDDWDNIGQRLTESGGVTIGGVRTPWASAAGYVDKEFRPRVYNTLNVPTIQLVFISFYLGIAAGALETAATYTRTKTRSWLHGGYDRAVDEPYVIDTYGDLTAKLWAVEALADAVAAEGRSCTTPRTRSPSGPAASSRSGSRQRRPAPPRWPWRSPAGSSRSPAPAPPPPPRGSTASGATSAPTPCTTRSPTSAARSGATS